VWLTNAAIIAPRNGDTTPCFHMGFVFWDHQNCTGSHYEHDLGPTETGMQRIDSNLIYDPHHTSDPPARSVSYGGIYVENTTECSTYQFMFYTSSRKNAGVMYVTANWSDRACVAFYNNEVELYTATTICDRRLHNCN
jgi:hypothetical protein